VKAEARARGDADPAERDYAEHQRAGGVADAVDDDPLATVADSGVFELVLIDEAADASVVRQNFDARLAAYPSRELPIEYQSPAPMR
jgi:hypothetical protein